MRPSFLQSHVALRKRFEGAVSRFQIARQQGDPEQGLARVARVAAEVTAVCGRVSPFRLRHCAVAAGVFAEGERRAGKHEIDASGRMDFVIAVRLGMCIDEILSHLQFSIGWVSLKRREAMTQSGAENDSYFITFSTFYNLRSTPAWVSSRGRAVLDSRRPCAPV
jgi:hypothetical protein